MDVIGISGMAAVMISCKTSQQHDTKWIYEIKSIADSFNACPVMAVTAFNTAESGNVFSRRAKAMSVSLWDIDTIMEPEKREKAFLAVIEKAENG